MDTILAILIIAGAGIYLFIKAKNRLSNKPGSNPCDGCAGCGSSCSPADPQNTCTHNPDQEQKITWH